MSRTIRKTRDGEKLPETLHRKRHYRCNCSWCLNTTRERMRQREATGQITAQIKGG